MRKFLCILGGAGLVGSLYYYFKKQLELALSYEYNLKNFKIKNLTTESVEIQTTVNLKNKSSFEIEVLDYNIQVFYKDILISNSVSEKTFSILADNEFNVVTTTKVDFGDVKKVLLPFVLNVMQEKPINVEVSGFVKVKFIGLNHVIKFQKQKIEYSSNLLKQYGLDDNWQNLKNKFSI